MSSKWLPPSINCSGTTSLLDCEESRTRAKGTAPLTSLCHSSEAVYVRSEFPSDSIQKLCNFAMGNHQRNSLLKCDLHRNCTSEYRPSMCQHSERTFNTNPQLGMITVVRIFCTTRNGSVRCCHVWCVQVGIVTKQAQSWSLNAPFQLLEQGHAFKSKTIRC
jgi:hypothetical protein